MRLDICGECKYWRDDECEHPLRDDCEMRGGICFMHREEYETWSHGMDYWTWDENDDA